MNNDNIIELCRICCNAGYYSIHARIPFFLHSTPNEIDQWNYPISQIIEEITGQNIFPDDGMPQRICSICISYMKHAYHFKRQAIKSANELRATLNFTKKNNNPDRSTTHLNVSFKARKIFNDHEQLEAELDQFFNENMTDNFEQNEISNYDDGNKFDLEDGILAQKKSNKQAIKMNIAIHNFFNYTEKTFQEDDISDFANVVISDPKEYREQKCHACKRRFMLNDSYHMHLKDCIEIKLDNFINDSYHLLIHKIHKAISSNEFIRRMIFSVKVIVKLLSFYYRNVTDVWGAKDIPDRKKKTHKNGSMELSSEMQIKVCKICHLSFDNKEDVEQHHRLQHNDIELNKDHVSKVFSTVNLPKTHKTKKKKDKLHVKLEPPKTTRFGTDFHFKYKQNYDHEDGIVNMTNYL